MPNYDAYQLFRPELTAAQREAVQAAQLLLQQNPSLADQNTPAKNPVVIAYQTIAMDQAKAQLPDGPTPVTEEKRVLLPEDGDLGTRFPGIDPVGKTSVIQMKFAQREAALKAAMPFLNQDVQDLIKTCSKRILRDDLGKQVAEVSKQHRILTRAEKLCANHEARQLLHQQSRQLEVSDPVVQYDMVLQGFEDMAGLRNAPLSRDVDRFLMNQRVPLGPTGKDNRNYWKPPADVKVEFQNFENKLLYKQFTDPRNWNRPLSAETVDVEPDEIDAQIPPYARATADRAVSQIFKRNEEVHGLGRADLLLIDGKSVREQLAERGQSNPSPAQLKIAAAEFTAAALMAGKRVEAFIPDKSGQIPKEPTTLTKSGYQPSPMKKVVLNCWEKYFSQKGFYKEKTAKAEEYKRVMDARGRMEQRVAEYNRFQDVSHALHTAQQLRATVAGQYFGAPNQAAPIHDETLFRSNRTAHVSFCMGRLAQRGHTLEDIVDPTMLIDEKRQIANEYSQRAQRNSPEDRAWYAKGLISGQKALIDRVNLLASCTDFKNERDVLPTVGLLSHASYAAYDLGQEITTFQSKVEPTMAAANIPWDRVLQQVDMGRRQALTMDSLRRSYQSQCDLYRSQEHPLAENRVGETVANALLGKQILKDMAQRSRLPVEQKWPQSGFYDAARSLAISKPAVLEFADELADPQKMQEVGQMTMRNQLDQQLKLDIRVEKIMEGDKLVDDIQVDVAPVQQPQQTMRQPQMGGMGH